MIEPKEYTLENLLEVFEKHSIDFCNENTAAEFNLPQAFVVIISEILDLKNERELHPWDGFLKFRYKVILWLKERDFSDEKIAESVSMDAEQVAAIFSAMENNF